MHGLSRLTCAIAVTALLCPVSASVRAAVPSVALQDLENRAVEPFQASARAKALVFVFTSVDCPISNRYAPEVRRLFEAFAAQGVEFWLVYPNPAERAPAIRKHLAAFEYPVRALRDPQHRLVKLTGAVVTPEAAVYDRERRLVYHGRIDNRYVSIGLERPAPTTHDLQDVLAALVSGQAPSQTSAPAIGCFIADFVQ